MHLALAAGRFYVVLAMLTVLLASSMLISSQPVRGEEDLVRNGGFESLNPREAWKFGKFTGVGLQSKHAGFRSARVGTMTQYGTIEQTALVPVGKWIFSFWYMGMRGDNGTASVQAWLLANDTILGNWNGIVDDEWHQVTFDLGDRYAGQSVTMGFTGHGDFYLDEVERQFCPGQCPPNDPVIIIRLVRVPVYVYVDDVSIRPTGGVNGSVQATAKPSVFGYVSGPSAALAAFVSSGLLSKRVAADSR